MKKLLVLLLLTTPASAQVYFSSPPVTLSKFFVPSANDLMQNFNRFISDGNTAFNLFATQIAAIGAGVTPAHAVVGFNLGACPTGWSTAAYMAGNFPMVTNGSPAVGTLTQDEIVDHGHTAPGTFVTSVSVGSTQDSFAGAVNPATSTTAGTVGAVNSPQTRTGTETRPVNIALLYCEKN